MLESLATGPALGEALLAIAVVTAGAALQASIGFGFALVAAPVLILLDRLYVPAPTLLAALLLTLLMSWRERHAIDRETVLPAFWGRILGTPPAALAVAYLSTTGFDLLFGLLVLAAVGASLVHREIAPTPRSVFFAAVASGFMGTVSSIGGPPLALVYQNASGAHLRANLSALFVVGCVASLIGLAAVGRFGAGDLARAAVLAPGILLGLGLSRPLVRALDRTSARPFVLVLSSVAALVVLARALSS